MAIPANEMPTQPRVLMRNQDVALAVSVVSILMVLVIPIPTSQFGGNLLHIENALLQRWVWNKRRYCLDMLKGG